LRYRRVVVGGGVSNLRSLERVSLRMRAARIYSYNGTV